MANVRAFRNGNWSDTNPATSPWGTGGVLYAPAASDVIYSNTFTIQIDVTTATGLTVTNAASASILFKDGATTTATAGGSFNLNTSGVTLNAAVIGGTVACVTCSLNSPSTVTINGNITGSATTNVTTVNYSSGSGAMIIIGNITGGSAAAGSGQAGVTYAGTGSLTITGNLLGGSGTSGNNFGVTSTSTGTVTITGTVTGAIGNLSNEGFRLSGNGTVVINGNISPFSGGSTGGYGVNLSSGGTITITGTISGGNFNSNYGVNNGSTGTITINGNCTGGTAGTTGAVILNGGGNIIINGNITGGSASNAYGVNNTSATGTITINGDVTGGTLVSNTYGVINSSTGRIIVNGTVIGSDIAAGAFNNSTGSISVTRARGNGFGVGTTGKTATAGLVNNTQSNCYVKEIEYGALGQSPTQGIINLINITGNLAIFYISGGGTKSLVDPNASLTYPLARDVRSGISYASGNYTGTLIVPSNSSVAFNVSVDSGVGTAILRPQDVWDYMRSGILTSGSIGERLKNAATVQSVGDQIASF